jgi:Flp pilus assembly protein TadD
LGIVYFRRNELEKAEAYLKAACLFRPEDHTIYTHLGAVYSRLGVVDSALASLQRAIELNHEDAKALYLKATCLASINKVLLSKYSLF